MRSDLVKGRAARAIGVVLLTLGVSTAAFGLPWDIDMADSQALDAYRIQMKGLPEGVVSQENVLSPMRYTPNFTRGSAEGEALVAPFPASPEVLAEGKRMYGLYCAPCHGADGVTLGPVAQPGRFPGVVALGGPTGIAKARSDGWIYLTVRNGGAVMPAYGPNMNDHEMWSLVHFVRTLPNAQYTAPAAPMPSIDGGGI